MLAGIQPSHCTDVVAPAAVTQLDTAAQTPEFVQINNIDASIQAQQKYTYTVVVDRVAPGIFAVFSPTRTPGVSLVTPNGERITSTSVSQMPSMAYNETTLSDSFLASASFSISDTVTGVWTVEITNDNVGGEELEFTATAYLASDLYIQANSNQSAYAIGDAPVITATVFANSMNVADLRMIATIWNPDLASHKLELYDDGSHRDGAANDGVFGNVDNEFNSSGYYRVSIDSSGTSDGMQFTRSTQTAYLVKSNQVTLTGSYFDFIDGGAEPGMHPNLVIMVEVRVRQDGEYALTAALMDQQGNIFRSPAHRIALKPGLQFVPLTFDGQDIFLKQSNGPYNVTDLMIFDSTTKLLLPAVHESDVWSTNPYEFHQFSASVQLFLPLIAK